MSDREAAAPRRGRPVVLVGAFLVPFVLAFAAAYLVRVERDDGAADLPTAASTTVADTTVPDTLALPSTTVADTTVPDTTVVDTTAAPTTVVRPVPQVSAAGAFLSRPGGDDRRLPDPDVQCGIEGTGGAQACDVVAAGGTDLAWVVLAADDGSRVLQVFQRAGAAGEEIWSLSLQAGGGDYRVRALDVTGDGVDDLVVGRRVGDADSSLQVDVVDVAAGQAEVSLHVDLVAGVARVTEGQLDLWNGVYDGSDARGSPSSYDHWVVQRDGGSWQVAAPVQSEAAGAVPPSQL